jgi:hypothetical protein
MTARAPRRLLTVVATTALAVVCSAGVVELLVRLTWDPRKGTPGFLLADPVRGLKLAPGYTGWFAGVPVHINSLGLRDPREYGLRKAPGTFRILVLGDSVTFGHGSVYEHTYPYLLEQRLRAWRRDVDWQVWNAAVPGYNTSQELAHLLQVGPRFQPDLVVVGFYENDLVDNYEITPPGLLKRATAAARRFASRHLYSLSVYERAFFQLAWKLSSSDAYRRRLAQLADGDALLIRARDASTLQQQTLTNYERLTDEEVGRITCPYGQKLNPDDVPAMQRQPGYGAWLDAVRGFQRLNRDGSYRIIFFVNAVPAACPEGDVFYDGGTRANEEFYVRTLAQAGDVVSCYDAFMHTRPSQMPLAASHSIGNSNDVKAEALFMYLSDRILPPLLPAPAARAVPDPESPQSPPR